MIRMHFAVLAVVVLAGPLRAQPDLPLIEDADGKALRLHVKNLLGGLEKQRVALPAETLAQLRPLLDKEPTEPAATATAPSESARRPLSPRRVDQSGEPRQGGAVPRPSN